MLQRLRSTLSRAAAASGRGLTSGLTVGLRGAAACLRGAFCCCAIGLEGDGKKATDKQRLVAIELQQKQQQQQQQHQGTGV